MTREEILNMPAGREIDALIAEKFFGFRWLPWSGNKEQRVLVQFAKQAESIDWWGKDVMFLVPYYSEDISAAWEVFELLSSNSIEVAVSRERATIGHDSDGWSCSVWWFKDIQGSHAVEGIYAKTAPLAICRAAMILAMEKYAKL